VCQRIPFTVKLTENRTLLLAGPNGQPIERTVVTTIATTGRSATVTTSTSHLAGVIAANTDAIAADKANAQAVFRASATAHDAVASTVSLGEYRVEVRWLPAKS
jgi:hypothetical protein